MGTASDDEEEESDEEGSGFIDSFTTMLTTMRITHRATRNLMVVDEKVGDEEDVTSMEDRGEAMEDRVQDEDQAEAAEAAKQAEATMRRNDHKRVHHVRIELLMSSNPGMTRMRALKLLGPTFPDDAPWPRTEGSAGPGNGSAVDEAGTATVGGSDSKPAHSVAEPLRHKRGLQFVPGSEPSDAQRLALGTDSILHMILSFADGTDLDSMPSPASQQAGADAASKGIELSSLERRETEALIEVIRTCRTPKERREALDGLDEAGFRTSDTTAATADTADDDGASGLHPGSGTAGNEFTPPMLSRMGQSKPTPSSLQPSELKSALAKKRWNKLRTVVRFGLSSAGKPVSHHRPAIISHKLAAVCFGWLLSCDAHGGGALAQKRWHRARKSLPPMEQWQRRALAFALVEAGKASAFLRLCAEGIDVTWVLGQDSLLMTAARHGNVRCLQWLLATGMVDVDAMDSFGRSAAHLAAQAGHLEAVATLVRASANSGHEMSQSYRSMIRGLADAVNRVDLAGRSLLHYACSDIARTRAAAATFATSAASSAAAAAAADADTPPDDGDVDGPTATAGGQKRPSALKLVSWLCRQGADVMHVDESGAFPLQVASQQVKLVRSNGTFKSRPGGAVDVVEFLMGRMIKQQQQLKSNLQKLVARQRQVLADQARVAASRREWTHVNTEKTTRWRVDVHRPYLPDRTRPLEGGTGLWSTTPKNQRWSPGMNGRDANGTSGAPEASLDQTIADTRKLLQKCEAQKRLLSAIHVVNESSVMWWIYDVDSTGCLKMDELQKTLTKWGRVEAGADSRMVAHILAHFDFDGSGMIEREEFLAMVDRLPPPISQEEEQQLREKRSLEAEFFREKLMQFRNSFRNMDYHSGGARITEHVHSGPQDTENFEYIPTGPVDAIGRAIDRRWAAAHGRAGTIAVEGESAAGQRHNVLAHGDAERHERVGDRVSTPVARPSRLHGRVFDRMQFHASADGHGTMTSG